MRNLINISVKRIQLQKKPTDKKPLLTFCLVVLASMGFYNPSFITFPNNLDKFIYYGLVIYFGFICFRKANRGLVKKNEKTVSLMKWMIVGLIVSAFNAHIYKDQDILISLIATLQRIGFLVFLFLCNSTLTLKDIEKVLKWFTIIYVVVASINFICGYGVFGSSEIDLDRGGVRFRLGGLEWLQLYLLLIVNRYIIEGKRKYLYIASFLFFYVIMSLTRQVIGITFLAAFWMLMKNIKLYKKITVLLVFLFAFIFILPKMSIYQKLQQTTTDQMEMNDRTDDVRIVAFNYFAFDYPRNLQQILFGVGIPSYGNSKYGIQYERNQVATKLYREDVGYAGFYFDHGIIPLGLLLVSIILCMIRSVPSNVMYAKYYLFMILLEAVASAPFVTCSISIVTAMYILLLKQNNINGKAK